MPSGGGEVPSLHGEMPSGDGRSSTNRQQEAKARERMAFLQFLNQSRPDFDGRYLFEKPGEWLSSDSIWHATELHREEFKAILGNGAVGLQDPLCILNSSHEFVSIPSPQILNVGENHWVVVVGSSHERIVTVYDSLSLSGVHPLSSFLGRHRE